jgi:hypothetical protein
MKLDEFGLSANIIDKAPRPDIGSRRFIYYQ